MNEPLQEPSPQQPQQITLTEEQQKAIDLIKAWFIQPEPKEFKLGGYAGTGKTTIIKFLLENLETSRIEVSAFTGKACNVLQRKGIRIARTLHSLMYDTQVINGAYIFHLKSRLDMNPALIIVDEASMVSTELYNHLNFSLSETLANLSRLAKIHG
jgi:exodeoxyribonuclease-5